MMELLILLEVEYFKGFLKLKIFKNINKCRSSDKNVLKDLHYVKVSLFGVFLVSNAGKYGQEKLQIRTLFTQYY